MLSKWTVLPVLVGLLVTCLIAAGIYQLRHGSYLDQMFFKRSLRENKTVPLTIDFPTNYHSTGRLFLPHSNIVEPFEIWFTKDFNRSRIDYYYGTDKTYQRADLGKYGVTFKVVPMHTEKDGNYIGCWNLEGHEGWPIIPQPIVPDMSHFKYTGEEVYMGTPATRWEYRYMVFGLLNAHTLLVSKLDPVRPVRYEMKGYDSLMASYYDKYVLEYISFEDWKPDLEKFELPKDQWCYNWSHSIDSHFVSNPMREFMSYGEDIVEEMYHMYKNHHKKVHNSKHEHVKRKHIFRHNMRYIRSMNRKNLTYKLAPNHLVDLTDEEYDEHAGLSEDNSTNHKGGVLLEDHHEAYSNMSVVLKTIEVPDELDWREYGAVTSVRGQGICGSCYALGAVGAVEGAYFMKTGRLLELSAQQVVDCSWGSGNHGCRGGWYNKALSWIYMNGVAEAKNYGPYLAQEGTCETLRIKERIKIDAFAFVPKYNNSALKRAIAKYGPACVSINQKPLSLKFYSWGIYDNPECDGGSTRHTVLVVGYGNENGVPYWLIKNSWSSSWGMDGYIKLAWKDNICGVTKNPVVALFKQTSFQFPVKEKIDHVNPSEPDSMGRKMHPQHRPGFHGNINGSSFHGKANRASLNNSGLSKIDVGGRKSHEHLHRKANKTNKNLNNVPSKTRAHIHPANKVSVLRAHNPSAMSTRTNVFNLPKVHKTKDKIVDKSAVVHVETIDPDTEKDVKNSDKTAVPFEKGNNENGQREGESSDEIVETVNSHVKELESQREVESEEKMVEANNLSSNELVAPEYKNPNKNTEEPLSKDTFKDFAADVYEHGQNLGMYNIQGSNKITADHNSIYNIPERTEHVAEWNQGSQDFGPDYYYPLYNYDVYKAYPSEYETPEGVLAPGAVGINHPYEENIAEETNLNHWLPSEQATSERFDAASEPALDSAVEGDFPLLGSAQKQQEQVNVKKEDSIAATIKPTTPTPRITATLVTTSTRANTRSKVSLTRTIKSEPRIASKPVRHYSGKLQDIYDKLEEVIASSLKKNKLLRKNNVLKGY